MRGCAHRFWHRDRVVTHAPLSTAPRVPHQSRACARQGWRAGLARAVPHMVGGCARPPARRDWLRSDARCRRDESTRAWICAHRIATRRLAHHKRAERAAMRCASRAPQYVSPRPRERRRVGVTSSQHRAASGVSFFARTRGGRWMSACVCDSAVDRSPHTLTSPQHTMVIKPERTQAMRRTLASVASRTLLAHIRSVHHPRILPFPQPALTSS